MPRVAFLFPGQGAQTVGMGERLAESLPAARALFDRANEILGYDLASICFKGPAEKLDSTDHSQPALFVTGLAALESLRSQSPEVVDGCEMAAGLSLGEYTALVFAGVMDFETGLKVVQERGRAMQASATAVPSGMAAILRLELDQVEKLCDDARGDGVLQVANLLCPGNIVVSGSKEAVERAVAMAEGAGALKAIPLSVAGAFHTSIMNPAQPRLADALANAKLNAPRIPVVMNVDAKPHSDPGEIRELLIKQIVSPVRWEDSVRLLLDMGADKFYEVGPGRVLRGTLKQISRKTEAVGTMD